MVSKALCSFPTIPKKKKVTERGCTSKLDYINRAHTYGPALRRQRQEDHEFKDNLGYICDKHTSVGKDALGDEQCSLSG